MLGSRGRRASPPVGVLVAILICLVTLPSSHEATDKAPTGGVEGLQAGLANTVESIRHLLDNLEPAASTSVHATAASAQLLRAPARRATEPTRRVPVSGAVPGRPRSPDALKGDVQESLAKLAGVTRAMMDKLNTHSRPVNDQPGTVEMEEDGGNPLESIINMANTFMGMLPAPGSIHELLDLPACMMELFVQAGMELAATDVCMIQGSEVPEAQLENLQLVLDLEMGGLMDLPAGSMKELCKALNTINRAFSRLETVSAATTCLLPPASGVDSGEARRSSGGGGTKTSGGGGASGGASGSAGDKGSAKPTPNLREAMTPAPRLAFLETATGTDAAVGALTRQNPLLMVAREGIAIIEEFVAAVLKAPSACADVADSTLGFGIALEPAIGGIEVTGLGTFCALARAVDTTLPRVIKLLTDLPPFQAVPPLKALIDTLADQIIKPIAGLPGRFVQDNVLPTKDGGCVLLGEPMPRAGLEAVTIAVDIGVNLRVGGVPIPPMNFHARNAHDMCLVAAMLNNVMDGLDLSSMGLEIITAVLKIPVMFMADVISGLAAGSSECRSLIPEEYNTPLDFSVDVPPFIYIPSGIYVADNPSFKIGPIIKMKVPDVVTVCTISLGFEAAVAKLLKRGMSLSVDGPSGKSAKKEKLTPASGGSGKAKEASLHELMENVLAGLEDAAKDLEEPRVELLETGEGITATSSGGLPTDGGTAAIQGKVAGAVSGMVKSVVDSLKTMVGLVKKIIPDVSAFKAVLQVPTCLMAQVVTVAKDVVSAGTCNPDGERDLDFDKLNAINIHGSILLPVIGGVAIQKLPSMCQNVMVLKKAVDQFVALGSGDGLIAKLQSCVGDMKDTMAAVAGSGSSGATEGAAPSRSDAKSKADAKSKSDASSSGAKTAAKEGASKAQSAKDDSGQNAGKEMDEKSTGSDEDETEPVADGPDQTPSDDGVSSPVEALGDAEEVDAFRDNVRVMEPASNLDLAETGEAPSVDITNMAQSLIKQVIPVVNALVGVPLTVAGKLLRMMEEAVEECQAQLDINTNFEIAFDPFVPGIHAENTRSMCALVKGVSRIIQNADELGIKEAVSIPIFKQVPLLKFVFDAVGVIGKLGQIPDKLVDMFPKAGEADAAGACTLNGHTYESLEDLKLTTTAALDVKFASFQLPMCKSTVFNANDLCRVVSGLEKFVDSSEDPLETILKILKDTLEQIMSKFAGKIPGGKEVMAVGKAVDGAVGDVVGNIFDERPTHAGSEQTDGEQMEEVDLEAIPGLIEMMEGLIAAIEQMQQSGMDVDIIKTGVKLIVQIFGLMLDGMVSGKEECMRVMRGPDGDIVNKDMGLGLKFPPPPGIFIPPIPVDFKKIAAAVSALAGVVSAVGGTVTSWTGVGAGAGGGGAGASATGGAASGLAPSFTIPSWVIGPAVSMKANDLVTVCSMALGLRNVAEGIAGGS